jgi:hypothetical protein
MAFHLVLNPGTNFDELRSNSERGLCPRQAMAVLADRLGAIVHVPHPQRDLPNGYDRLRARLIASGETWALARRLTAQLGSDDVIFCQSQDVGFPVAAAFGMRGKRPKLLVSCDNIISRRNSLAARVPLRRKGRYSRGVLLYGG